MAWKCIECDGTEFQLEEKQKIVKYELKFDEKGVLQDCEKDIDSQEYLFCIDCKNYTLCDDIEQIAKWEDE